jgi:hypothetical protein
MIVSSCSEIADPDGEPSDCQIDEVAPSACGFRLKAER